MGEALVRLQRFLAEAGVASRRAAEAVIQAGQVRVNGQVVRELGTKVHPGRDRIEVGGQCLERRPKRYIALNKPAGYLCTRQDPAGRRTVFELLPAGWGYLYTVGRLDGQSEGLLFLTNDGSWALRLTHPRYGCPKTYRVEVAGCLEPAVLARLQRGVEDRGERLRASSVHLLKSGPSGSVVELVLREGKNREIRRMFQTLGFRVERLQRTRIGRIGLRGLPVGRWRALTEPEISSLLQSL